MWDGEHGLGSAVPVRGVQVATQQSRHEEPHHGEPAQIQLHRTCVGYIVCWLHIFNVKSRIKTPLRLQRAHYPQLVSEWKDDGDLYKLAWPLMEKAKKLESEEGPGDIQVLSPRCGPQPTCCCWVQATRAFTDPSVVPVFCEGVPG